MRDVLLILRGILWMISFGGLCLGARMLFRLNRFIAPFFVSGCVIVLLMLTGMTGIGFALPAMFFLLYAAGFVGAVCAGAACAKKRFRIDPWLCGLFALFAAFLVWRFYPSKLYLNDDISHWGLVARTLLRYDRFPNGSMDFIYFQSYPVGAASFVYYVCRTLGNIEGLQIAAQNFLMGAAFLPVFALAEGRNKRSLYALSTLLFFVLFYFFRARETLQVDILLAFFGIGIAGVITYYRNDLGRAVSAAMPALMAVCAVKSSGMFFIAAALLLIWNRFRKDAPKKALRGRMLAVIVLPLAFYGLWLIYIRFAYPAALDSKHAVSAAAYMQEISSKGTGTILQILRRLARRIFTRFGKEQKITLVYLLAVNGLIAFACRNTKRWRACLRGFCENLIPYLLWCVALAGMYIVSMPGGEALSLAGFDRYNETGLLYLAGLNTISLIGELGYENALSERTYRLMPLGAAVCAAAFLCAAFAGITVPTRIFWRHTDYTPIRSAVQRAASEYGVNKDGSYIFFSKDGSAHDHIWRNFYVVKYELEKGKAINMICEAVPNEDYCFGTRYDVRFGADVEPYLREKIGETDAIVLLEESPEFEATLERFYQAYPNDVPVYRAYP